MKTKTDKALGLWRNGEVANALSIFSKFKFCFSTEQKRILQIACDVLHGHRLLYEQMGIDCNAMVANAKDIINQHYYAC